MGTFFEFVNKSEKQEHFLEFGFLLKINLKGKKDKRKENRKKRNRKKKRKKKMKINRKR